MPVPQFPPTPQSSADITGQDKPCSPASEHPLELPPPAVRTASTQARRSRAELAIKTSHLTIGTSRNLRSPSPSKNSPARKRRRPSMSTSATTPTASAASNYSLPPPPTRSRTIIQMQPGASKKGKAGSSSKAAGQRRKSGAAAAEETEKEDNDGGEGASTPATKAGSAGGKRLARKTAHSVIERRRRSKMNEEFDTMKEMIPACRGQTMHKLAILQAGIDYLRYLERCVAELKAANEGHHVLVSPQAPSDAPQRRNADHDMEDDEDEDEGSDEYDEDNPAFTKQKAAQKAEEDAMIDDEDMVNNGSTTPSGSLRMAESRHSNTSNTTSASLWHQTRFSGSSVGSAGPSPTVQPFDRDRYVHSLEASPALPESASRDADYEATTALLMLNSDRSSKSSSKSGRGLSVQDLLSG